MRSVYVFLWFSFLFIHLSLATSSEPVTVTFVKGVTRLNKTNYHDFYFSCHSVGLFLQWQYESELLSGFRASDVVGRSTVLEASGFIYTTTLLSSMPAQGNNRAMDSVLVVSFIGDYPSSFTVSCSNGPLTRTVPAGLMSEVDDSSRYETSFNDLVLDYIGSERIVNNRTTHLFVCGAQHSSQLLQANGPPISFSSSDEVGFSRSPSLSTYTVDVQGIFIARNPFMTTSLLIVADESDESEVFVTCFYQNQLVRVSARPRVSPTTSPTTATSTATTLPAIEPKTTDDKATTLNPGTAMSTTADYIGVVSDTKSTDIIAASLGSVFAVCIVMAFSILLIIYLKKCRRSSKVKFVSTETGAKEAGSASQKSGDEVVYLNKEKIREEEGPISYVETRLRVNLNATASTTETKSDTVESKSVNSDYKDTASMTYSKSNSMDSAETATTTLSGSDSEDSAQKGSIDFRKNEKYSKQIDLPNEVNKAEDQFRNSLRQRIVAPTQLDEVMEITSESDFKTMGIQLHVNDTPGFGKDVPHIFSAVLKEWLSAWSSDKIWISSTVNLRWKNYEVHQVQDGGAQFATMSSGKLEKMVYVKQDGKSFEKPVKLKDNPDTSRNAPKKKFSYWGLRFKELLHSIGSPCWATVKNFEFQMAEYLKYELPLLQDLAAKSNQRKNAKMCQPISPEEDLNKACVLTPKRVVATDKFQLYSSHYMQKED